ncbi:hypothetical protein [Flagellimonas myxillae]|uniref:hypothetical protein n=1 Tax=Flagellimonas myxillae TaxID=2942214 RepID=UPI00201EE532|nr:hypothetical protein [Muricauda myxillae]MCL6267429.1 hypothetical protein [Muricauda myxillae]
MKALFILVCLLGVSNLQGQKQIKKAILDSRTEFIQIDTEFCYQVTLQTARTKEVHVEAYMEGEYAKDLLVNLEEKGATMLISAGFQPNFINPNDKLSAHKVISIALKVTVPRYSIVSVFGTNSNVDIEGEYKNLVVKLGSGKCTLNKVLESVEVDTQNGDILVLASQGNFSAVSTYGLVEKEEIPNGDNQYILSSVEGTIRLKKTK